MCFLKSAAWLVSGAFVVTAYLVAFVGVLLLNEHYRVKDRWSEKEAEARGYFGPGMRCFTVWSASVALSHFVTHLAEQITGCG